MRGVAMGIRVVFVNVQISLMTAEGINDVQRLPIVRADDLLGVGWSDIGGVGVNGSATIGSEMGGVTISIGSAHSDLDPHAVG